MRKRLLVLVVIFGLLLSMFTNVSAVSNTTNDYLAAHWKFDEGNGTAASDSSGSGIHGTLVTRGTALPIWTPGKANGGIAFDGTTNYVDIGFNLAKKISGASEVTLSIWVNNESAPASSSAENMVFSHKIDGKGGLSLSFTSRGVKLGGRSNTNDTFLSTYAPFNYTTMNNSWHHIIGIMDYARKEMRIYIDGVLQESSVKKVDFKQPKYVPGTKDLATDRIGNDSQGADAAQLFYAGQVDEVQVFRKALSQSDITALYEEGKNANPGNPSGGGSGERPVDIIPVVNQDIISEVYGFNGTKDYLNIGSTLRHDLHGSSAVTVSAWVHNEDLPEANKKEYIITNKINDADAGVEMYLSEHRLKVGGRSIATDSYQSKEVAFDSTKAWHYLVGVVDYANDEIRIYVDGDLQNKTDKAVNFSSTTYMEGATVTKMDNIGRDSAGGSYFKGSIRNIRVSNRALSDEEIRNNAGDINPNRIRQLAENFYTIFRTNDGQTEHTGNAGIVRCPNGRLIASFTYVDSSSNSGRISISDDGGVTWTLSDLVIPFIQARLFVAGDALYALGRKNDLMIMKSTDWGDTWGPAVKLTNGEYWESSVNTVVYNNGYVYTAIEKRIYNDTVSGTLVNALAPVLMRANVNDDLTDPSKWTYASALAFRDVVSKEDLEYFGTPFYDYYENPYNKKVVEGSNRYMHAMGWLETNVVQVYDPKSYLYDPNEKTFYLISRSNTGSTGYATILKVVENDDGTMTTSVVTTPSGKKMLFIPFPGGQMKFCVIYDEVTNLYWLASTQATDSMTLAGRLASDRYDNSNGERRRLQLSYSKNLMDWVFAGSVAIGPTNTQARHYTSMVIDGDDLLIISRSGDADAPNAHDGNMITLHNVKNFRSLVYSINSAFVEDTAVEPEIEPDDSEPEEDELVEEASVEKELENAPKEKGKKGL